MFLEIRKKPRGDYLIIREKFAVENGYKTKTIQSIGYLNDLMDQYEDPISHFRQYVEEENQRIRKQKEEDGLMEITLNMGEKLTVNSRLTRNVGYIAVKRIYRALKLDQFWKKHLKGRKIQYDFEGLFFLLVAARLLDPGSRIFLREKGSVF